MAYRIFLTLIASLVWISGAARASDERYRVEVLVLTHLESGEPPREVPSPKNYSDAIDFLAPPEEPAESSEADAEQNSVEAADTAVQQEAAAEGASPDVAAMAEDSAGGDALASDESAEPPPLAIQIEEMSPVMQEAWRRLRLSAPFRPQQYLSWEQGSDPPFPLLRVHDQDVVMIDDPWADLRQPAEDADGPTPDGEVNLPGEEAPVTGSEDTPESQDKLEAGDGAEEEEALPDPIVYYRLDGTVRLRRTRFLHVDIDMSLREPVFEQTTPTAEPSPATIDTGAELPPPRPDSFRVYRLEQSRQVRTGRMEYFDSPVLGVLVYVTGAEPVETGEEDAR